MCGAAGAEAAAFSVPTIHCHLVLEGWLPLYKLRWRRSRLIAGGLYPRPCSPNFYIILLFPLPG